MAVIQRKGGRAAAKPRKTAKPEKKTAVEPTVKAKRPTPPKGKFPPRPKFEPTKEQRSLAMLALGAAGMTADQARQLIINPETGKPIGVGTFRAVFETESESAHAKTVAAVAGNLVNVAKNPNHKNCVTAAIFYLKVRAGWREPDPAWLVAKNARDAVEDNPSADNQPHIIRLQLEDDDRPRSVN